MDALKRTILYEEHLGLGAKMMDFGGYEMPVNYPSGILEEHLNTRKNAGLFDISHMGRFRVSGPGALAFLQRCLSSNVSALEALQAQYALIPDEDGGALDDAYLYRLAEEEYLLVVNASNARKDWEHLSRMIADFDARMDDWTEDMGMISLQGPESKRMLLSLAEGAFLTEPVKNAMNRIRLEGKDVLIAKTGYTGEPIGYELFAKVEETPELWRRLIAEGAKPTGLGARDTLRLEAGLPLYGHEFGADAEGKAIPIFSAPLAKFAVSFSEAKGEYIGRAKLLEQFKAFERIVNGRFDGTDALPRRIGTFAMTGKGVPRAGYGITRNGEDVGYVTSGSVTPYYVTSGEGLATTLTEESRTRRIGLALLRNDLQPGDEIEVDIRGKKESAVVVRYHLRSIDPPFARVILHDAEKAEKPADISGDYREKALHLVRAGAENHMWRQTECLNLIPSEQTHSRGLRLLSILDPSFRYGEHKKMKSFYDSDVFYYQGTKFLHQAERLLTEEFKRYFGCREAEIRAISGQMSNAAVFSALLDFKNRANRKRDAVKLGYVLNHHILYGGHLSAQPMGSLHDCIAVDPATDKAALVNFPPLAENPYKTDLAKTEAIIERYRPELIILGKSMTLHKEPVAELRRIVDGLGLETTLMYDMAHVLGLVGPYFQDPFAEGAEIVTGSTHKTFFGSQRGVIAADYDEDEIKYELWESIENRVFPGSVSNHHPGTLIALLMAAYEMNCFRDEYQKNVIENAKCFARSLAEAGLDVAGDPSVSYTETHQVIVKVGYAAGPETAERLEENNIIVNYQATPEEEGFTAAGALRLGVAEMTRFGFGKDEFERAAELIAAVIKDGMAVKEDVKRLRSDFTDLRYCFTDEALSAELDRLAAAI